MDSIVKWFLVFLFGVGCGYAWHYEQMQSYKPIMAEIQENQGYIALELQNLQTRIQLVEGTMRPMITVRPTKKGAKK